MRGIKLLVLSVLVANALYATVVFPKPLYRSYLNLGPQWGQIFACCIKVDIKKEMSIISIWQGH